MSKVDQTYIAVNVHPATITEQDNWKNATWVPEAEPVKLNNPIGGYLSNAALINTHPTSASIDTGMISQPGTEYLELQEEDKGLVDALAGTIDNWVVVMVRTWKLQQSKERVYVNNRTSAIWAKLLAGTNSRAIMLEVHVIANKLVDGKKSDLGALDCMNNDRLNTHGLPGHRMPSCQAPVLETPAAPTRWSPNLCDF